MAGDRPVAQACDPVGIFRIVALKVTVHKLIGTVQFKVGHKICHLYRAEVRRTVEPAVKNTDL